MNTGLSEAVTATLLGLLLAVAGVAAPAAQSISILGLFRDMAIIEIDGQRQRLTAGESRAGVRLISANSREAVLEVNGVTDTYTIGDHISSDYRGVAPGRVVMIAPDSRGMYYVNGSINGFQVRFVVDTGATLIAMNRQQARRLGLNYRLEGREATSATASGVARVYIVDLESVRVGDIQLRDVRAAVHDGDFPQTILLGNSFLGQLAMRRDGQLLELHQR